MKKLKTSRKTILSVTLVSLCILSFMLSAQATSNPIISYHLHKGTTVGGVLRDIDTVNDVTLDIRLRRRGFWPNYFYEIIADFVLTPAKFDYIKVNLDHNIGSELIKITAFYTNGENEVVAWVSKGSTHQLGIDGDLYLGYIRVSYNRWTSTHTLYYVYIDYLTAI